MATAAAAIRRHGSGRKPSWRRHDWKEPAFLRVEDRFWNDGRRTPALATWSANPLTPVAQLRGSPPPQRRPNRSSQVGSLGGAELATSEETIALVWKEPPTEGRGAERTRTDECLFMARGSGRRYGDRGLVVGTTSLR